jgi:nucleoid-associated protein YgaU
MPSKRSLASRFLPVFLAAGPIAAVLHAPPVDAQSLQGSRASVDLQYRMAQAHDYTLIDTPARVRHFAEQGWLVPVRSGRDFVVKNDVSFPYARPEVKLFIERLGTQYRTACGEQLVVTSLTRPASRQPANASDRSVHPTGMALDIRYSWDGNCRRWLEGVLLSLERQGVLEATLERRPRHYHVALFPKQYGQYLATRSAQPAEASDVQAYRVQRGDSLWKIARSLGVSVDELRATNGLDGSRIFVGQVLDVPTGS